jgi:hypothetical protein
VLRKLSKGNYENNRPDKLIQIVSPGNKVIGMKLNYIM